MSAPAAEIESAPQSAHRLVISTLRLYRRYPLLFLILAAVVIVPYRAIVLALTGAGPFGQGSLGFGVSSLLDVTDLALVTPLVSALHVHAVSEVREGREPRLGLVARQGLRVLPVVAAASIVSWLGDPRGIAALHRSRHLPDAALVRRRPGRRDRARRMDAGAASKR